MFTFKKTGNAVTIPLDLLNYLPVQAQISGKLTWTHIQPAAACNFLVKEKIDAVFAKVKWWFHYRALTERTSAKYSKHPVKTNEGCVQSFTHVQCVSAFELKSSRANGSATLIKSIKQQRRDTHLDLPFLLQNTPEHIWNSVYPDAKRAFCRTAREGASERKAEYLFTFSGLLTCIFLTVEPFGKAVSSTSKYTMFRATRRTEIACKQHGWKQT